MADSLQVVQPRTYSGAFQNYIHEYQNLDRASTNAQLTFCVLQFKIGLIVSHVANGAEFGDRSVEVFAEAIHRSRAYVYERKKLAEHPLWQFDVSKFAAWLDDQAFMVTWSRIRDEIHVSKTPPPPISETVDSWVKQKMYALEDLARKTEERREELQGYLNEYAVSDDVARQAEGVILIAGEKPFDSDPRLAPKHMRIESEEYLEFVRSLKCPHCGGKAEPEHPKTRGAGGSDVLAIPECRTLHDYRHQHGIRAAEAEFGVSYLAMIIDTQHRFITGQGANLPKELLRKEPGRGAVVVTAAPTVPSVPL